jgi:3,4-dihydroxy 2-butanone 4-phosphate synthase / GTP cyclohydrolase II
MKTDIGSALAALAEGRFVLVTDDEGRENEGDLIMAAQHATPEALAFLLRRTSGIVCVALSGARTDELQLPPMAPHNTDAMGTAFTVSVDLRAGTTTGISATDRARTIRALADPATRPGDLRRPGHVFPLRARDGGVLERAGHTEAAVDLMHAVGLRPAGMLAEVTNDDGTVARRPELERLAEEHDIPLIGVDDIVRFRREREPLVQWASQARLPTRHGEFTVNVYRSLHDGREHVALVKGNVAGASAVLVRVHSECLTGDLLGSVRCDCGQQLDDALRRIADEGRGVLVYLRGHEGRGIGLVHKVRAYRLQDQGRDTLEANLDLGLPVDARDYAAAARILDDLEIKSLRLLTNNPRKVEGLQACGIEVAERVELPSKAGADNLGYLRTKRDRMGHLLALP